MEISNLTFNLVLSGHIRLSNALLFLRTCGLNTKRLAKPMDSPECTVAVMVPDDPVKERLRTPVTITFTRLPPKRTICITARI